LCKINVHTRSTRNNVTTIIIVLIVYNIRRHRRRRREFSAVFVFRGPQSRAAVEISENRTRPTKDSCYDISINKHTHHIGTE